MTIRAALTALALAFSAAPPLSAQELPAADGLIAAYVEAIGGREAQLAPTSIRQVGTVTISGLGISGDFELLMGSPNRMSMRISLPALGEILSGFDGEAGWTVNPLIGPMVMSGAELAQAAESSHWLGALRDPSLVPGRETVERAEYGGESCWKVRLTWASGRESFDCYSTTTGLLVAAEETQTSPMGDVPVLILYLAYQEFGALTIPSRISQTSSGQSIEIEVREVEVNGVDPSAFLPPPAVRTLLGSQGGD